MKNTNIMIKTFNLNCLAFVLIILLFSSCQFNTPKTKTFVNLLYGSEGSMSLIFQEVFAIETPNDLNGLIPFRSEDKLIAQGEFAFGHKKGLWTYPCYNDFKVLWKSDTLKDIIFTVPQDWSSIVEKDKVWFTFPTESENLTNKYFQFTELDFKESSIQKYNDRYKELVLSNNQIAESYFYTLNYNDKSGYFSVILKIEDEEEILILDALIELDGKNYEMIYKSLNINLPQKHTVFLEVLKGIEFNGGFILPPLGKIWSINSTN